MLEGFFLKLSSFGAEWVLWVLVLLSVLSLAVVLERFYIFFTARDDVASLEKQILNSAKLSDLNVKGHGIQSKIINNVADDSSEASIELLEENYNKEFLKERIKLERGLSFLATVGSNSPFIGLFGTVIGIINAFLHLSKGAGLSGGSDFLMASISEALIATGVGILVAIPAVMFFNYFRTKIQQKQKESDIIKSALKMKVFQAKEV